MVEIFDTQDASNLLSGSRKARQAISQGRLIVVPTDTVYGVAADAFSPDAVTKLLEAKGRDRTSPPPVLVHDMNGIRALAFEVPESIEKLGEAFWPGPLTIIFRSQPSLSWDLGDTSGTVALRIPDDPVTLEILRETGPLAVSSANLTGEPAATTAEQAEAMLGQSVEVILDAGAARGGSASTILDATQVSSSGGVLKILRPGPISMEQIAQVCPELTIALAPKRKAQPEESSEQSLETSPETKSESTPEDATSETTTESGS